MDGAETSAKTSQTVQQIRYALSQLNGKNGHHEFEHLCRAVARLRITPNILPATGPVADGGDQGRDFETFHSYILQRLPGSFLAVEDDQRIVFACTLQRDDLGTKIRNDICTILDGGPVARAYFFCEQDVTVSRRHKLRDWAWENHRLEVEIIDGQALSELLVMEDCLWIAERYLDVGLTERRGGEPAAGASLPGDIIGNAVQGSTIQAAVVKIYHSQAGPRLSRQGRHQAIAVCLSSLAALGAAAAVIAVLAATPARLPSAGHLPVTAGPSAIVSGELSTTRPSARTSQAPKPPVIIQIAHYYRELENGYAISSIQDPGAFPVPVGDGKVQDLVYQFSLLPIVSATGELAPLNGTPSYQACALDTNEQWAIAPYQPSICFKSRRAPVVAVIQIVNWEDFRRDPGPYTLHLWITVWERS